jgi:hypothetical protein
MGFSAGRKKMTGQRAGSHDKDVFRGIRFCSRGYLIIQNFGHKASATNEVLRHDFR